MIKNHTALNGMKEKEKSRAPVPLPLLQGTCSSRLHSRCCSASSCPLIYTRVACAFVIVHVMSRRPWTSGLFFPRETRALAYLLCHAAPLLGFLGSLDGVLSAFVVGGKLTISRNQPILPAPQLLRPFPRPLKKGLKAGPQSMYAQKSLKV